MANLNEIKQKIIDTAGVVAEASADIYRKAEGKTKVLAKTAKLQGEIVSEKSAIRKLYQEIGKMYYETHKLFPEPELEQACAEISAGFARVEEKLAAIEDLKAGTEEIEFDIGDDCDDEDCDCDCDDDDCDCDDAEIEVEVEITVTDEAAEAADDIADESE